MSRVCAKKKENTFSITVRRLSNGEKRARTRPRKNSCRTPLERQQNSRFNGGWHVFLRQIVDSQCTVGKIANIMIINNEPCFMKVLVLS